MKYNISGFKVDVSFLWFSVLCDDIEFVKFLLERNGKYDDKNNGENYYRSVSFKMPSIFNNATPLFVAVTYTKNRDMIDLFIEHGADINTRDICKSTPLMNVFEEPNVEYYDFLISRGAKVNLRCKSGMAVLHYLIRGYEKYFDVALHLIKKHKADTYLLDNKNHNGFMMFAIELNSGDYYQEDFDGFGNDSEEISPCYEENEMYIEKLLEITNPPLEYVRLVYNLFAACINFDPSLKKEYFDKAAAVNVGGNYYHLMITMTNGQNDLIPSLRIILTKVYI